MWWRIRRDRLVRWRSSPKTSGNESLQRGRRHAQFYAVAIVLAFVSGDVAVDRTVAFTYVGLRVVHSVMQATVNVIEARFAVFIRSSLVVLVMTVPAALATL